MSYNQSNVGFQSPNDGRNAKPQLTTGETNNAAGSDILDSNTHELQLEKSNILLLGPTGSGI